jgi:hypothetical protein
MAHFRSSPSLARGIRITQSLAGTEIKCRKLRNVADPPAERAAGCCRKKGIVAAYRLRSYWWALNVLQGLALAFATRAPACLGLGWACRIKMAQIWYRLRCSKCLFSHAVSRRQRGGQPCEPWTVGSSPVFWSGAIWGEFSTLSQGSSIRNTRGRES